MYFAFYALNDFQIRRFLREAKACLEGDERYPWSRLLRNMREFRRRGSLSMNLPEAPLTHVSEHVSPALGWEDLREDVRPQWGDERVTWVLRQMILGSCDVVLRGQDARFYYAFTEWLPRQGVFESPGDEEAWDFYCRSMFLGSGRVPDDLPILQADGNTAYFVPAEVADIAGWERERPFLRTVASRLAGKDNYSTIVAEELVRIDRFVALVEAEKAGLYYNEPRS